MQRLRAPARRRYLITVAHVADLPLSHLGERKADFDCFEGHRDYAVAIALDNPQFFPGQCHLASFLQG